MATAKSCRRAMVAVRNRHLGGAPLPLDDLLKEHPFIQVALVRSTYPYRASCGRWRCARCTVYLKETFLWLHTCTHGLPLQCDDLQAAGLFDAERGACRLCGAKCRASESTHACLSKLFNSAVFDLSDFFMPPGSEAADYEAWTHTFRKSLPFPGIPSGLTASCVPTLACCTQRLSRTTGIWRPWRLVLVRCWEVAPT